MCLLHFSENALVLAFGCASGLSCERAIAAEDCVPLAVLSVCACTR